MTAPTFPKANAARSTWNWWRNFLRAFCYRGGVNAYVRILKGGNRHHEAEAVFKALARCLKKAVAVTSARHPFLQGSAGMTGILDYGAGNLRSVQKACEYLGENAVVTSDEKRLDGCDRLIFARASALSGRAWRLWNGAGLPLA